MEGKLDAVAWIILILSILAGVIIISEGEPLSIGIGIGVIFQGIIWYILFLSFAEVIKLLKKIANIHYEGRIYGEEKSTEESKNNIIKDYQDEDGVKCNNCGLVYSIKKEFCPKCYAKNEEYEW